MARSSTWIVTAEPLSDVDPLARGETMEVRGIYAFDAMQQFRIMKKTRH
jgi:hypothetical protein